MATRAIRVTRRRRITHKPARIETKRRHRTTSMINAKSPTPQSDEPAPASDLSLAGQGSAGRDSWNFVLTLVAVFFVLSLIKVLRHEMWRDELQAWMVAASASSLAELRENLRYEGHPGLWHLCLFAISRVTNSPVAMQIFHVLIATASTLVVCRFAPWSRLNKALFCFGYFPFFEYATISRNYAPGMLLAFVFCAVYCHRKTAVLTLSLIASLLAQTSVYGIFIAAALALGCAAQMLASRRRGEPPGVSATRAGLAVFILGLAFVLSIAQFVPPADSGFATEWRFALSPRWAAMALYSVWRTFIPLPLPIVEFWNTNFLDFADLLDTGGFDLDKYFKAFQVLASLPILGAGVFIFARRPAALAVFVSGLAIVLLFTYVKYWGYLRHHGAMFVIFAAAWWLYAARHSTSGDQGAASPIALQGDRWRKRFISILLTIQFSAGMYASAMDLVFPFSSASSVVAYLNERGLEDRAVAGDWDSTTSSVSGYLRRPIYYPSSDRIGTFIVWDDARWEKTPREAAIERIRNLAQSEGSGCIAVLSYPLAVAPPDFELLATFDGSIVFDENYWLYAVSPRALPER